MNGIFVEFRSRKELEYVQKVMRRKGIALASYIVDNFEWDDMPECINASARPSKKICSDCEWNDRREESKAGDHP